MTVTFVDDRDDSPLHDDSDQDALRVLAESTLELEGLRSDTEVAISLIGVGAMIDLNETHMGKTGPTDVLSFPLESLVPGDPPAAQPSGPPVNLGDVFICPKVVADNAAATGVPFRDEMALMVVHGLLHLLGYDHVIDSEAEQMEQRERDLLARAGLVRP